MESKVNKTSNIIFVILGIIIIILLSILIILIYLNMNRDNKTANNENKFEETKYAEIDDNNIILTNISKDEANSYYYNVHSFKEHVLYDSTALTNSVRLELLLNNYLTDGKLEDGLCNLYMAETEEKYNLYGCGESVAICQEGDEECLKGIKEGRYHRTTTKEIDESIVKADYESIYGPNTYEKEDYVYIDEAMGFLYSDNYKKYYIGSYPGGGVRIHVDSKLYSAEKNSDYIYITENVYVYDDSLYEFKYDGVKIEDNKYLHRIKHIFKKNNDGNYYYYNGEEVEVN